MSPKPVLSRVTTIGTKRKTERMSGYKEHPPTEITPQSEIPVRVAGDSTLISEADVGRLLQLYADTQNWAEHVQEPHHLGIKIKEMHGGHGLVATQSFEAGEVIFGLQGQVIAGELLSQKHLVHALQVGENAFLVSTDFDNYLLHSSDPSCYFRYLPGEVPGTYRIVLTAKRRIKRGEVLSFNYDTTEADLKAQGGEFAELDDEGHFVRWVVGYLHLSATERALLASDLSPYLLSLGLHSLPGKMVVNKRARHGLTALLPAAIRKQLFDK